MGAVRHGVERLNLAKDLSRGCGGRSRGNEGTGHLHLDEERFCDGTGCKAIP
jgi:hypothetical protein